MLSEWNPDQTLWNLFYVYFLTGTNWKVFRKQNQKMFVSLLTNCRSSGLRTDFRLILYLRYDRSRKVWFPGSWTSCWLGVSQWPCDEVARTDSEESDLDSGRLVWVKCRFVPVEFLSELWFICRIVQFRDQVSVVKHQGFNLYSHITYYKYQLTNIKILHYTARSYTRNTTKVLPIKWAVSEGKTHISGLL